ncbi:Dna2/Cas4 domain-containing protein [Sphingobacterium faecale]|uniref:Dna2/Cas4 domain-containing protein n=1 Tax=Sphingobacterium faecale TaxID=2803775 RepID=A0ABS1R9T9_9SPHI|nr:Dna2/Cas4 domain-containing protein [Sphingobacterium faecale]
MALRFHETKRRNKVEEAHTWQVKFYLWLLHLNGVEDGTGIIEYPLLRQTNTVELTKEDIVQLNESVVKISNLQQSEQCPSVINEKICKSCSYYELCYIDEE